MENNELERIDWLRQTKQLKILGDVHVIHRHQGMVRQIALKNAISITVEVVF